MLDRPMHVLYKARLEKTLLAQISISSKVPNRRLSSNCCTPVRFVMSEFHLLPLYFHDQRTQTRRSRHPLPLALRTASNVSKSMFSMGLASRSARSLNLSLRPKERGTKNGEKRQTASGSWCAVFLSCSAFLAVAYFTRSGPQLAATQSIARRLLSPTR